MKISDEQRAVRPGVNFAALKSPPALICLLLALATLIVFWPVERSEFISYDDPEYVVSNPHVQSGLTADNIVWAFSHGYASNWHPLTWMSHMLDVTLFGPGPRGPHVVNLLLHAANADLLFLVLFQLTATLWRSALVAALFALHPLHVESVAWVSERKDVLSTFFWMLALLAYGRFVAELKVQNSRAKTFYALSLIFFALGLMSKPMLVTLPFVLLLLDFWPLGRFENFSTGLRLVREKIPFFALSVVSSVITFLVQKSGGAVQPLTLLPLSARLENAIVSYWRYLGKCLWPAELVLPYPHEAHWPMAQVVFGAVLVAGVSAAVIWRRRGAPYAFTGWFWFVGTLIPVIGLVQVGEQSLADRYTYVPVIGVFIAGVWGAAQVFRLWHLPKAFVAGGASLVIAACAVRTADQLRYWQNGEMLSRHALALTKNNWMAHHSLAVYLAGKGDAAGAISEYRQALQINPNSVSVLNNLGAALCSQKQFPEAIDCFKRSLQLRPDYARAHCNLGFALEESGDRAGAFAEYTAALRLAPDDPSAHFRLGNLLVKLGRFDEAIEHFRFVVQAQPDFLDAWNNLGVALFNKGQFEEAGGCFLNVLRLDAAKPGVHLNLGNTLAAVQNWNKAAEEYREELRLAPDSADAHFGLARALVRLNRRDEAVSELNEALRLRPDFAEAKKLLKSLGVSTPQ